MDLIGKTVRKEFLGLGILSGTVKQFDASRGFYEILYENDSTEELELSQLAPLIEEMTNSDSYAEHTLNSEAKIQKKRGRKPKKRRKVDKCDAICSDSGKISALMDTGSDDAVVGYCLGEGLTGIMVNCNNASHGSSKTLELENGLGENVGERVSVNAGPRNSSSVGSGGVGIDLNLDVSVDVDGNLVDNALDDSNVLTRKQERGFDLNLGYNDVINCVAVEETPERIDQATEATLSNGCVANGALEDAHVKFVGNAVKSGVVSLGPGGGDGYAWLLDGIQNADHVSGIVEGVNKPSEILDVKPVKEHSLAEAPVEESLKDLQRSYDDIVTPSEEKKAGPRKRRKLSENMKSATETVLRRSARRGVAALSAQNHSFSTITADEILEERLEVSGCKGHGEVEVLPAKLPLPPSDDLNLEGIPILDLFSVYACLRSFSTLLFLSPFELEDFVTALKCDSPNSLFDSIHVSVLQVLRKQLEFLSNEGHQSASYCLRDLNWDLLDLITWPIYVAAYLLFHGSILKPGHDLSGMNLFKNDYYKQPTSVKLEILRSLCDDLFEAEAIRTEINRRTSGSEFDVDSDRNGRPDFGKRKRSQMYSGGSCLAQDMGDGTTDWNSDECCLCKMDGSLICCDGCPAAYHSRCVGVASNLLPEGDWFCAECVLEKKKPYMTPRRSLRGAELLGIDPYDRMFYGCYNYLLVSESNDAESSSTYYHCNNLGIVIEVLKSSHIVYSNILGAISKYWNLSGEINGSGKFLDSQNHLIQSGFLKGEPRSPFCVPLLPSVPSGSFLITDETVNDNKESNSFAAQSGNPGCGNSNLQSATLKNFNEVENPLTNSEGSVETSKVSQGFQNMDCNVENILSAGDCSFTSTTLDSQEKKCNEFGAPGRVPCKLNPKGEVSDMQHVNGYFNYYSCARVALSIAEELARKKPNKINEEIPSPVEDIISLQVQAILKNSTKFCWTNLQESSADAQKEKCGWCFSCQTSTDNMGCLFMKYGRRSVQDPCNSEVVGFRSQKYKKSHLIDILCQILSMEGRLRGLLLGPWLSPHHSKIWCKGVIKAIDIMSAKHMLLMLESNLHHLTLSAEWFKHVDSVPTMGSAAHIVTSSSRFSTRGGIGRKRARCLDSASNPSSNAATGLGLLWWRGGSVSRKLFNWKLLPRSLVSKAARQGGRLKIPGVFYPDGSEFAKRRKCLAWRAAVEASTCAEQLALQVRELDLNINWDDIENTRAANLDKELSKAVRPFKKVIIRRKCIEDSVAKYLLDFGKRKIIPDIVVKHGTMIEESSSGRKKYWLEESHVPLHLLKCFEEKRIARKSNAATPVKTPQHMRILKRSSKKDFSYLFSRAEKSENYQCRHCNKDVLISEAVRCKYCKGFFHKRHVRKSAGIITSEFTYTCHKCQGEVMKIERRIGKLQPQSKKSSTSCRPGRSKITKPAQSRKNKKACTSGVRSQLQSKKNAPPGVPLRRSSRIVQYMALQKKKVDERSKGKKPKRKKGKSKKSVKRSAWQKKRTQIHHPFWLNGLQFSRKPNDERTLHFRKKQVIFPSDHMDVTVDTPKCQLCCEFNSISTSTYICCEFCKGWFHGDAYGVNAESIVNIIGFRCHLCCNRNPPVCPKMENTTQSKVENNSLSTEEEVNVVANPSEKSPNLVTHLEEDILGSSLDDETMVMDKHVDTIADSNQTCMITPQMEVPIGKLLPSTEAVSEALKTDEKDLLPGPAESTIDIVMEENRMEPEHVSVSLIEEKLPSCGSNVVAVDAEVSLLGQGKAADGLLLANSIQKVPVEGGIVDSLESNPEAVQTWRLLTLLKTRFSQINYSQPNE
ncbi:Zinc finger, PHD-finger [Dillenia turbinata]|uniref:Zinc finger, PHD-finger n=1 Tax=Dillenia turbinata TaxID=194707 RepID=A0AAN8V8Q5_9MAGN